MNKFNVKINYLYNSGFVVETKDFLIIFDYFLDKVHNGDKCVSNGALGAEDLKIDKKILVFASHSHNDHFNPVILKWMEIRSDIDYILSSDINVNKNADNIHILSPYDSLKLYNVVIKVFGSTDIGVSFLINVDGVDIFHAGDLNWWYWWDDTDEEKEYAERMFKQEIEKIKGNNIDIAFFPVDPRLKDYYYIGAEYFVKEAKPDILIPMHFGSKFKTTKAFAEKIKALPVKTVEISKRGQEIVI